MTRTSVMGVTYRGIDETKPCPECRAEPGVWCTNPITGNPRRVPCVRRPRVPVAGDPAPAVHIDTEVVELDFSEPRHPADLFIGADKNLPGTGKVAETSHVVGASKLGDLHESGEPAEHVVGADKKALTRLFTRTDEKVRRCSGCATELAPDNTRELCAECQLTARNS